MGILAYILVNTDAGKDADVLVRMQKLTNVREVHMVAGVHDIIATVNAKDFSELGKVVTEKIHRIEGVSSTVTCIIII